MSLRRARGSRLPFKRPKRAFHSSVPGVSRPTSFLFQRGQPTSAALARSREAGTARPLISSVSVSVWKWNWLFTQARTPAGTYSSQIAGGSTMWLSQPKTGKDCVGICVAGRGPVVVDGATHPLVPGTACVLGYDVTHEIVNDGAEELVMMWLITPPGLEEFFKAIGRPRTPGQPAPAPFARPEDIVTVE